MNVITQGAKTGLYVWISTQFLAVTDKDPLKACAVKFLGTQDHITEVKHTLDLIPEARGKFTADDIMRLRLGHWVLVRKRPSFVGIVYSLPIGVPEEVGVEVSKGIRTPESVRDEFLKVKVMEENEMWKEKYLELERQHAKLKEELEILKKTYKEEFEKRVEQERQKVKELETELANVKFLSQKDSEQVQQLLTEKNELLERIDKLQENSHQFKAEHEVMENLRKLLIPLGFEPSQVNLEHKGLVVNVRHAGDKVVKVSTESVVGQILFAAIKYFPEKEFTASELNVHLLEHGWNIKSSTLSAKLSLLTNEGKLVKTDKGYRLPSAVRYEVGDES
jgi:hypothetical protein